MAERPPRRASPGLVSYASDVVHIASAIATGRHPLAKAIAPLLWVLDAALCVLIIWKVPYWVAYMDQISQVLGGERDYSAIKGSTGPLVYPAAHVYTYSALYWITDKGTNILRAQQIFAVLYMATLALVMSCYRKARAPPFLFPLLILSKRLHSVYMLRCFNDCFAVLALWGTIYLLQRRQWTAASLVYSWGLGTKMSLLLVLPALGVILFQSRGLGGALAMAGHILKFQVALAAPFMQSNPWAYLGRAFELSRVFKYEWTVNWRMVDEKTFLSKSFADVLLLSHALTLLTFVNVRWLQPCRKSILDFAWAWLRGQPLFTEAEKRWVPARVTPEYVMTTILSANATGLLFARSLHYQFYAYIAWSTPFLLWRAGTNPVMIFALWAAQEWAWNVFPSTTISSLVVVDVLGATVWLAWKGTEVEAAHAEPVTEQNARVKYVSRKTE